MKTKIVSHDGKEAIMIYTDKQERYTPQIEEYIAKSKEQYGDVAVFVSGNNELETVLYTLIHDKYNG